jgi:hypothetical protein
VIGKRLNLLRIRKGKELKTPCYTSAVALYNNYITTHDIIPNNIISKTTLFCLSNKIIKYIIKFCLLILTYIRPVFRLII